MELKARNREGMVDRVRDTTRGRDNVVTLVAGQQRHGELVAADAGELGFLR